MSCNAVMVVRGRKIARAIRNEEEYRMMRNATSQLENLAKARGGDAKAKMKLLQFNYSGHYPDGVVKGCKLPSKAYVLDIDDKTEFEKAIEVLLKEPEKYGLLMLERSVNNGGHIVCKREQGKTILENQVKLATMLQTEMDTNAHDINRVLFATSASADDLLYVSPELFTDTYDEAEVAKEARTLEERERYGKEEVPEGAHRANKHFSPSLECRVESLESHPESSLECRVESVESHAESSLECRVECVESHPDGTPDENTLNPKLPTLNSKLPTLNPQLSTLNYLGIPYSTIISKYWELHNDGKEPEESNRNMLTFDLAHDIRGICGYDRELLRKVIPNYDGFPEEEKMRCIDSALSYKPSSMPRNLKVVLDAIKRENINNDEIVTALEEVDAQNELYHYDRLPKMPQGVRDSIDAAGHPLAMAALIGIAPAIGALATGVKLDVHGKMKGLNLCSFIAGEFASGKGQLDDIIGAWMYELQGEADMFFMEEEEYAEKARRTKTGKLPEQVKRAVRMLTLNNTVANIADRLGNADGKHCFSFTPEADNVALKWKQSVSDFSVMLRQAYDEARYDREAKSAEAVRVHIPKLLWNVTMCGTQDALYRVITNYTDGLLSRMAIARTPDNTFAPLADHPAQLSDLNEEHIHQVAHLLPYMQGQVVLDKLEAQGRQWLEKIRRQSMENDDKVLARQRFRTCVNAQRITTALWLPKVAELLIKNHGMTGAEKRLKAQPDLWIEMLKRQQTDEMMQLYDLIADYLIDNDLYFFRDRIEQAYASRDMQGSAISVRAHRGKNDSIYNRLSIQFTFEQAYQQSMVMKGSATRNSVKQMLKNWKAQGLIAACDSGYVKLNVSL